MRISEIFASFQGEGFLTGTPSIFVRVSGCPLRCTFCDTAYAQNASAGAEFSVEETVKKVRTLAEAPKFPDFGTPNSKYFRTDFPAPTDRICHVVLTGGEPMACADSVPLTAALRELGFHITVETCGTRVLDVTCDLMSISPKMSNSGNPAPLRDVSRTLPELVRKYEYQIKFVVDTASDLEEIEEFLCEFSIVRRNRVILMPQGQTPEEVSAREEWLRKYAYSHDLQVLTRAHLYWYGNRRGT